MEKGISSRVINVLFCAGIGKADCFVLVRICAITVRIVNVCFTGTEKSDKTGQLTQAQRLHTCCLMLTCQMSFSLNIPQKTRIRQ
ncbi:hypothetical protein [uncultured Oxalicibacterium sp.]|uniref:hypothetical protein n=1 Tax=uncultured Oxalicibacterium sp. TaxID=1168540 RepID=UPI0025F0B2E5|nr:hypothetical protein [uncultured Oxalicibacterium sp.]